MRKLLKNKCFSTVYVELREFMRNILLNISVTYLVQSAKMGKNMVSFVSIFLRIWYNTPMRLSDEYEYRPAIYLEAEGDLLRSKLLWDNLVDNYIIE